MTVPAAAVAPAQPPARPRDHGFHELTVREVVRETDDACSLVLDVPPDLTGAYAYSAGQFLTFRVSVAGTTCLRSYSMSSSPEVDRDLRVTVKRVPGGAVSTWINTSLRPGDTLASTVPAGHFCLTPASGDVVALAGGSGITPVFSLLKTALATTQRRVRLLYANRDRASVIFAADLDDWARRHPERLSVAHHLDVEDGFVQPDAVRELVSPDADYYVCGPGPFMALVEQALLEAAVPAGRIHIERFTTPDEAPADAPAETPVADAGTAIEVTVELGDRTVTTTYRPGTTLLQTARQAALKPPFSCEAGDCATCMARLVQGTATMRANNALTDDEVAEGWVLTCQAVPTSPTVHVVYEEG